MVEWYVINLRDLGRIGYWLERNIIILTTEKSIFGFVSSIPIGDIYCRN